ncbi:MAG: tetratricopeptide repeat protein [bacterium]|nr:tetratricopeptide repeat protein [bacterium]
MLTSRVFPTLALSTVLALLLNSGYLAAGAEPTLFYLTNVAFHTAGGVLLLPLLLLAARRFRQWCQRTAMSHNAGLATAGFWLLAAGLLAGVGLIVLGNYRPQRWLLYTHIGLCSAAIALFLLALASRQQRRNFSFGQRRVWRLTLLTTGIAVLLPGALLALRATQPDPYRVENPLLPPLSQDGEGMYGKQGPFHPAGLFTSTGGKIPSNFFMTSKRCADCHADIYRQWSQSAHRFSSFNNQWYRKSIEYMQDVIGIRPTRWCAGCHDVALLLNGMMDTPVRQILDTPEAQVGLACTACHAITQVRDTMGNSDYRITYPALSDFMASDSRLVNLLHDFLVRVDPAPHRQMFLKPFHRGAQSPAFCSTCHKVHLDTHVNNYRWFRGFNEYDAWQASGVSGYGARSFYYPDRPKTCTDCHMPLVPSDDLGNLRGYVHSHRFPGANTALPTANKHPEQLAATVAFLQSGVVTLDIFGLSPAAPLSSKQRAAGEPARGAVALSTTFPIGEEQAAGIGRRGGSLWPARPVLAPLDTVSATVQRGTAVLVEVVVRNRGVGHFFPGGTIDAFDIWIEFKAVDNLGQVLFWSGAVADGGRGPVEPGAHFYRAFVVDQHGNEINKRNAWAARAVVYARAIPPGSADVAHFRLFIPEHAGQRITLTAKLNHRKFRWWNTQWAFAGVRDPQQPRFALSPHYDDGDWVFTGDTSTVSGPTKAIPDLPIVVMAHATATIYATDTPGSVFNPQSSVLRPRSATSSPPSSVSNPRERWNDYGIGLLLQGDLRGAEAAFQRVADLEPEYADGWVNLGRVRLRDGDIDGARQVLTRALRLAPTLPRARFFMAMVLKSEGDYEAALSRLRQVAAAYPDDRVVRNQMGRLLFLLGRYAEARSELERVLRIDPENLQAHYNLMLCLRALGDEARSEIHHTLFRRFKADEPAQVIAGIARQRYPGANNESQPVHEHQSISLPPASSYTSSLSYHPSASKATHRNR